MSKTKKSIILFSALVLIVALSGVFVACNPGEAKLQTTDIEGVYIYEQENVEEDEYFKSVFEIKADNAITWKQYDAKEGEPILDESGTYTVDEETGTLSLDFGEGNECNEAILMIYKDNLYLAFGKAACEKIDDYYKLKTDFTEAEIRFNEGKVEYKVIGEETFTYDYRFEGEILFVTGVDEDTEESFEMIAGILRGEKFHMIFSEGDSKHTKAVA